MTPAWKQSPERGSVWAMRLLVALDWWLGRRLVNAVLWCVVTYYALTASLARRASREFFKRLGQPAAVLRHLFTFARVSLDRALFATGATQRLHIELVGHEHIMAAKGALVLGAHLGSFEALQALSQQYGLEVTVLVDLRNARRLAAVMDALAPSQPVRFVAIDETDPTAVLGVQETLARGGLVAVLADRVTADASRTIRVPFLGVEAAFPIGPFVMAHALGCPVLFACALYSHPNRYTLYCEPLAQRVSLPRATRQQALVGVVSRYAVMLERYTRQQPGNWFNFYDFWK